MARVVEKRPVDKEKISKIFMWIGVGVVSAVAVFLIVLLVMFIVDKVKKDSEETYESIYAQTDASGNATINMITYEKLADILDDQESHSGCEYTMYVYVFTSIDTSSFDSDYKGLYADGELKEMRFYIEQCAKLSVQQSSDEAAFYVLDTNDEDNEYASTSFLSNYISSDCNTSSIPSTNYLMVITNTSNVENSIRITEIYTYSYATTGKVTGNSKTDMINALGKFVTTLMDAEFKTYEE